MRGRACSLNYAGVGAGALLVCSDAAQHVCCRTHSKTSSSFVHTSEGEASDAGPGAAYRAAAHEPASRPSSEHASQVWVAPEARRSTEAPRPAANLDLDDVDDEWSELNLGAALQVSATESFGQVIETTILSLRKQAEETLHRFRYDLIQELNFKMKAERAQHASTVQGLRLELEEVKELLQTYTLSAQSKDVVIQDLKSALANEQHKVVRMSQEYTAKKRGLADDREQFLEFKAARHYEDTLKRRHFRALHGVIQSRWKSRMQRACQNKAQEVCVTLCRDYEEQIQRLTSGLEEAHAAIAVYKQKKAEYEENMRKAFMRGVCALNMEAMSMWSPEKGLPGGAQAAAMATATMGRQAQASAPPPVDHHGQAAMAPNQHAFQHLSHAAPPARVATSPKRQASQAGTAGLKNVVGHSRLNRSCQLLCATAWINAATVRAGTHVRRPRRVHVCTCAAWGFISSHAPTLP